MSPRSPWRRLAPPHPGPLTAADPAVAAQLAAVKEQLATEQMRLTGSRERNADLTKELADATRELTKATGRVAELELVRDGLAGKLAVYEDGHNITCGHAKEAKALREQLAALADVNAELQAANEARDRPHDHTRSFIPYQNARQF